jgi:hypothetical protein
MTPKEKAQELFQKYESLNSSFDIGKKGALIALDEIINASPMQPMIFLNGMRSTIPYWQEVKKEIEAL